jgi:hypothetical protein
MNNSPLQCSWFAFTIIFHCSNSLLRIEDANFSSRPEINFAVKLSSELYSEVRCINFISRGVVAKDTSSEVYKISVTPVVIGHNYTDFPCQEYFMLVDSKQEIFNFVNNLHFRTYDNVVIFILNDDCPSGKFLDGAVLGAAQVAVVCGVTKSTYRLDISGDLRVVTDNTNLFQDKTSSLEDYMGRSLTVSTFYCPPFSYGTGNDVNSSSYKEGTELSTSILHCAQYNQKHA